MNAVSVIMNKTLTGEDINFMGFRPKDFGLMASFNGERLAFVGNLNDTELKALIDFVEICPMGHQIEIYNNREKIW